VNSIKTVGGGLALQVTDEVRSAGLVEEQEPEEIAEDESGPWPTYRADVRVHAFEDVLLVVDRDTDRVARADAAELVASAARDTETAFDAAKTTVQVKGHGYMVQLPPASDAGFRDGHSAPAQPAPGIMVIHKHSEDAARLGRDLAQIRYAQVESEMNHEETDTEAVENARD